MVWEIETECDPGEGAHSWGKKDMVGDVTCLATYRCTLMVICLLRKHFPQWASVPRPRAGGRSTPPRGRD